VAGRLNQIHSKQARRPLPRPGKGPKFVRSFRRPGTLFLWSPIQHGKTDRMSDIKEKVKQYLLEELHLPVKAEELNNGTPLLSSRLIDSISALLLVEYLEKTFSIQFQPHEVNNDNLDSLDLIEAFVLGKQ